MVEDIGQGLCAKHYDKQRGTERERKKRARGFYKTPAKRKYHNEYIKRTRNEFKTVCRTKAHMAVYAAIREGRL